MTRKPFCCSYNGTEIIVPLTTEEARALFAHVLSHQVELPDSSATSEQLPQPQAAKIPAPTAPATPDLFTTDGEEPELHHTAPTISWADYVTKAIGVIRDFFGDGTEFEIADVTKRIPFKPEGTSRPGRRLKTNATFTELCEYLGAPKSRGHHRWRVRPEKTHLLKVQA